MQYWLMKSEPSTYSIDDLMSKPNQIDFWDGVRNYQVRNMLRDQMKIGDKAFFYHSNCDVPGIVGIIEIVKEGYPDDTAYDENSKYFDPKSSPENPRWFRVDVKFIEKFSDTISLKSLKEDESLSNLALVKKGNRLSIMPVDESNWATIIKKSKS